MSDTAVVDRRQLLSQIFVFASLGEAELDLLAERTVRKKLAAREELFHKGDEGNEAYAVLRGSLKAASTSEDGREITFSIMKEGEVIGEVAMLFGGRRTATVTALTPAELLVIHRRDLLDVMRRQPEIAIACMSSLAERLTHVSEVMEDTLFRNLPNRLARSLLALADEYGVEESDGLRIDLKLSQTELGNLVGATREAVNKQMRAFEQEGWLSSESGVVRVHDRGPLEALADPARAGRTSETPTL